LRRDVSNEIIVNMDLWLYIRMYTHTPNQYNAVTPFKRMARMVRKRVFKTKARGKCFGRKALPSIYCRSTCSGDPLRAA